MDRSKQHNYPRTVYDNAWEDLTVMYESWKTVHGVDRQFCIDMIRKFANYLENEKYQNQRKYKILVINKMKVCYQFDNI